MIAKDLLSFDVTPLRDSSTIFVVAEVSTYQFPFLYVWTLNAKTGAWHEMCHIHTSDGQLRHLKDGLIYERIYAKWAESPPERSRPDSIIERALLYDRKSGVLREGRWTMVGN